MHVRYVIMIMFLGCIRVSTAPRVRARDLPHRPDARRGHDPGARGSLRQTHAGRSRGLPPKHPHAFVAAPPPAGPLVRCLSLTRPARHVRHRPRLHVVRRPRTRAAPQPLSAPYRRRRRPSGVPSRGRRAAPAPPRQRPNRRGGGADRRGRRRSAPPGRVRRDPLALPRPAEARAPRPQPEPPPAAPGVPGTLDHTLGVTHDERGRGRGRGRSLAAFALSEGRRGGEHSKRGSRAGDPAGCSAATILLDALGPSALRPPTARRCWPQLGKRIQQCAPTDPFRPAAAFARGAGCVRPDAATDHRSYERDDRQAPAAIPQCVFHRRDVWQLDPQARDPQRPHALSSGEQGHS